MNPCVSEDKVSIPQGTIKRQQSLLDSLNYLIVSIPQGTIKSYAEYKFIPNSVQFQFHKVRLKDSLQTISVRAL